MPRIPLSNEFNGVWLMRDGDGLGDPCWGVEYYEGKSDRIKFTQYEDGGEYIEITNISLRPAPTMAYLNPRPAPDYPSYPWRYDTDMHLIKLPLPLTYAELAEGSQIVVSGISDSINVIEGTVEGESLVFRAGGLLIASVMSYEGAEEFVDIDIKQDFAGEILAVNFVKAFKNLPAADSVKHDGEGLVSYLDGQNTIAKCVLNGVVIFDSTPFIPSNGLLGNLAFQSRYIGSYGNVIESFYWTNGRYLYIIRLDESYAMQAINLDSTVSPLAFPII